MRRYILIIVSILALTTLISAYSTSQFDFSYPDPPTNYSQVNVNNSQFLRGYTPFNLPYLTSYSETDPVWTSEKGDYVPYNNANQNVNLGNYNVTADWIKGKVNYSDIQNHPEVDLSNYWTKTGAPQIGITSDKDGSFDLSTSGLLWGEQVTSSDDMRANGLIYNVMGASDTTGLSITQSGYTGGLAVAMGSITGNQNTVASTLNADISGLSQIINNNHDLSGTMAMFFQTTTGLTNTARDNSQFPSGAQMAISVQTYGMKNIAKKTSSANIYATSMFGDPQFDTFGIQNDVSSTNIAFKGSSNYLNNLYGVYNYIHPASHSPTSPATTTTNSYGEYMHLSGRTTGTTAGYGLYINSVYGFDNGYGIWDNSGEDWVLDANEQMIRLGETQGNFDIFYNGSVPYFSTNSNGGFHFWNSTGYSELHVHNIVYHTHEPTSNNTLEGFTEDTELYDVYTEVEDLDNCTQVLENTNYIYMKNGSILILDYEIPEEHWDIINITNVTIERNYNTVCGTKLIKGKSGGQLVEDLQSMATKLNKNVDLYDNLTDFDTGIMAENLYTQSKVINLQDNYAIKFLNASWLDDKVTHKNKITLTQDDLPEDKRDVLSVEDRIVDLEGAFSDHMTCMYLHKKYEDYRDCMFDINPKDKIK